jgi:NADH dehydrogenase/NADH:ubiquinone oxidoreductase subunit G
MKIDGKEVQAAEGMTVLEAARSAGISIPTLCHHEQLAPFGGCRLCIVEAEADGRKNIVASCVFQAQDDLIVTTRSDKIDRIRKSSCRTWPTTMERTKTSSNKRPHSAYTAVSAYATVPRSNS